MGAAEGAAGACDPVPVVVGADGEVVLPGGVACVAAGAPCAPEALSSSKWEFVNHTIASIMRKRTDPPSTRPAIAAPKSVLAGFVAAIGIFYSFGLLESDTRTFVIVSFCLMSLMMSTPSVTLPNTVWTPFR